MNRSPASSMRAENFTDYLPALLMGCAVIGTRQGRVKRAPMPQLFGRFRGVRAFLLAVLGEPARRGFAGALRQRQIEPELVHEGHGMRYVLAKDAAAGA